MIIIIGYNSNSQSVIPGQQQQYCLGTCWKCGFWGLPQITQSEIPERGSALCVWISPSGDYDIY